MKNTKNILLVSAPRSGSTYVSERLQELNDINTNLFEEFSIACNHFSTSYTQKAKYYDAFCKKWSSKKCIAKIKIPNDWMNGLGNAWLKINLSIADVYYISRNKIDHILDLISASQEKSIAHDWEETHTNIVVSNVEQIINYYKHLNNVDAVMSEMKKINIGHDITLEEIKSKDTNNTPKRMYNYINQLPQYDHLDIREAVSLIINNA